QFQEDPPPEVPMADNRTMAELLQAPTEGYEDAIIIPEITANNFELKHVVAKVSTSSSTPDISSDVAELKDMVKALFLDKKNQSPAPTPSTTPAPVKAVEPNCVTCGSAHSYQNCTTTYENAYRDNIQDQGQSTQNQCQNIQNQYQNLQIQMATLTDIMSNVSANTVSSSGSGKLPGLSLPELSQEVLGFSNVTATGTPTPHNDLIVSATSPTLTPFGDSNFLLFEEADAFLELGDEEKSALIKALKSHKQAIAWKLSDIQGINPEFYTYKILMKEDYKPAVQHQRRVNPKIYDVIKKEVEKLLDAGLIYPISDNEKNKLIPTRLVTGWQVCIDHRKLNEATQKNHFPLPFMDQMLERLAGNEDYCFLDGFSGYFQIPIYPRDQERTTFTCPYGTFAYRRMPFGLCNAPGTFQRCMLAC
nr:reverse transcriptase domain-containing protein [Tanacetum cinerariifolium]